MSYIYQNITGNSAVTLTGVPSENVIAISLANVHASDSVNVDLYITFTPRPLYKRSIPRGNDWTVDADNTTTSTTYLFKNLTIPFATTLMLHKEDIFYNAQQYSLGIKLSASDSAVDVIIQNEKEIEKKITKQSLSTSNSGRDNNIY
jgi:hypothetical protein